MQIQILELLICDTFSYQWCWKEVMVIPKENHTNARLKCKKKIRGPLNSHVPIIRLDTNAEILLP